MEGKELVVLRNEATATLKSPLETEPAGGDRKSLLPVFAISAPGAEAHALAGWIAVAVISLIAAVCGLWAVVRIGYWRLGLG